MNKRKEIIEKVHEIPAIPSVVTKIERMLKNPDVNFTELASLIKYEPGLTANILKMANSAYFGFSNKISSVQQAIVMMGTKRIHELAIAVSLVPFTQKRVAGYDLSSGKLWEHSVAVAIGAEKLAEILKLESPDYIFTAGLLIDIGKIVLGTYIHVDPKPIMQLAFDKQIPFDVAERRVLGIDHAETASILLKNWGLPKELINIVRNHHHPNEVTPENLGVDLVHAADVYAMIGGIGTGSDGLNYKPDMNVVKRLKLTNTINELVISKMESGLDEVQGMLSISRENE